jgi:hypothetical protein
MLLELGDAFPDGGHVNVGRGKGPLILSVFGPSAEVRVGNDGGPPLMPFLAETQGDIRRRMFQIVPTGTAQVSYIQEQEDCSTWTFVVRFEGPDADGRELETRGARLELVRYPDDPDEWSLKIVIDGVHFEVELRGYVAMPLARRDLLPPYARTEMSPECRH